MFRYLLEVYLSCAYYQCIWGMQQYIDTKLDLCVWCLTSNLHHRNLWGCNFSNVCQLFVETFLILSWRYLPQWLMCDLEAFCCKVYLCVFCVCVVEILHFVWSCILCLLDMHSKPLLWSSIIRLTDHNSPIWDKMRFIIFFQFWNKIIFQWVFFGVCWLMGPRGNSVVFVEYSPCGASSGKIWYSRGNEDYTCSYVVSTGTRNLELFIS